MEITERLIRRIARQEFGQMVKSGAYTRGSGGGGSYTLPVAADGVLGGVQLGYPTSAANRYYAVQLDSSQRAYVNVPWTAPSVSGSVSGSTLTITINGTDYSLTDTNTWRPVQNNLNSTATGDSLSAYQGYLLARGDARDSTKLPLAGGTMTGQLGLVSNAYRGASPYSYGLNCNNSDIIGINSLYMNDESDGWDEGIEFYRDDTGGWDSLRAYRGTWYFYSNNGNSYGNIQAQNGYAEGTWASKSDARMKNVVGDVDLTVEQIAAMPAVKFTWKNDPEKRVHVGTLAQPWQKVLPEAIETTQADTLMMCYGEAAMVSVIKLAQRVLELERMIKEK